MEQPKHLGPCGHYIAWPGRTVPLVVEFCHRIKQRIPRASGSSLTKTIKFPLVDRPYSKSCCRSRSDFDVCGRGDKQKVTGFEGTDLPDISAARVHQIRKAVSVIAHCCRAGLRALRSTDDPGLDQFPGGFLISRSGFAAFSGIPSPSHQIVLGNMLLQHR
jgi:hypothetical protein